MTPIGPDLLARLTALGFAVGVGVLYGLVLYWNTNEYRHRYTFKDEATRWDKATVWADYLWRIWLGDLPETAKYTLGWGAAGALLFALGTLLVAGIGAVFL